MNQSVGAHSLAKSSGVRKHKQSESEDSDWSDSEESQTQKDNQIRAVWSQVQLEWSGNDHKYRAVKFCVLYIYKYMYMYMYHFGCLITLHVYVFVLVEFTTFNKHKSSSQDRPPTLIKYNVQM